MPKKTEMQKLREKLKKQKQLQQKSMKQVPKDKKLPYRPQTQKHIKKVMDEEVAVKEFFAQLIELPDADVLGALEKFSEDRNGAWGRQRFFVKLINILPDKLYKEFATDYIAQDRKNLEDFFKMFIERPRVAVAVRRKSEIGDEEFQKKIDLDKAAKAEKKRLQKIQAGLFGDDDDDDDPVQDKPLVVSKKQMKLVKIGLDGEIIDLVTPTPPVKRPTATVFKQHIDQKCLERWNQVPWINGKVNTIYIAPVNGGIKEYISENSEKHLEGTTEWYPSNLEFKKLMCNNHSRSRTQDGNILTAFTRKGKPVLFKVAYDTNRGFIVQDEKIFNDEKIYLAQYRLTYQDKVKRILDGPIDASTEKIGVTKLSQALHHVAPDIKDYGIYGNNSMKNKYDTSYIIKAVETISNSTSTVREFFTKVADVIVYLTKMNGVGHDIFKKRVQEEYYLPEILVNLSSSEKLPEIFEDPRVTIKVQENATRRIKQEINNFISEIGKTLYQLQHPTERVHGGGGHQFEIRIGKVEKWKTTCVNKDDVINIPDEQIIYYEEGKAIYCLTIPSIMEQIVTGNDPVNPYTQVPLTEAFVTRFQELYSLDLKGKGYGAVDDIKPKTPTPNIPPQSPTLAPGLLNLIVKNIMECEEELTSETLGEDGKCKGLDGKPDTPGDDGAVVVEQITPGSTPGEDLFKSDSDSDSDKNSPGVVKGDICQYCKKKVDPKKCLKTKVDGDEGFQTVYFCCFQCFENQDYWPKKRSRKRGKRKKSSKKGGRNSGKERKKKK
jgi:hypothetical protein